MYLYLYNIFYNGEPYLWGSFLQIAIKFSVLIKVCNKSLSLIS